MPKQNNYTPFFIYITTAVHVIVFLYTLVLNNNLNGVYVESFSINPMLGPSPTTLITAGARFVPCMKSSSLLGQPLACPSTKEANKICSLEDICAFGGFGGKEPNQFYRFVTAIFLHGGIVHVIFNLGFQFQTGRELERQYGTLPISIIYILSGIGGFVFGAPYLPVNQSSVGASGSLFGLIGLLVIDIQQQWHEMESPKSELFKLFGFIAFSLAIGFIPQIDNFSHIGGFVIGLLTSLALVGVNIARIQKMIIVVRVVSGLVALILIITGIVWFYDGGVECEFCAYLNCMPSLFDCSALGI